VREPVPPIKHKARQKEGQEAHGRVGHDAAGVEQREVVNRTAEKIPRRQRDDHRHGPHTAGEDQPAVVAVIARGGRDDFARKQRHEGEADEGQGEEFGHGSIEVAASLAGGLVSRGVRHIIAESSRRNKRLPHTSIRIAVLASHIGKRQIQQAALRRPADESIDHSSASRDRRAVPAAGGHARNIRGTTGMLGQHRPEPGRQPAARCFRHDDDLARRAGNLVEPGFVRWCKLRDERDVVRRTGHAAKVLGRAESLPAHALGGYADIYHLIQFGQAGIGRGGLVLLPPAVRQEGKYAEGWNDNAGARGCGKDFNDTHAETFLEFHPFLN
jgi:hypothetical protein